MAIPKSAEQQKKPKGFFHKLKNSAIFWLLVIIGISVLVVYLIIGISTLLSRGHWPGL